MDEQLAVVLVALITAVVGPVIIAYINKISKRTANLNVVEQKKEVDVTCNVHKHELQVLSQSVDLLHQKIDMIRESIAARRD